MNTTGLRVVIDTNVLIAMIGLASPYRPVFESILSGELTMCITTEILYEYQEILTRKNGVEVADNMVQFFSIHPFVEKVEPFYHFKVIEQDPDDNKFIDCAVAASVDCIVSNDRHFSHPGLMDFPKVRVLTAEKFLEKYYD
ncbi:MAG: putative toxin-antitoxin system toxin component, PIN family [Saprospiraceae bacterium]|nr:putative toxin-antitoxin system toxin component, PIN family [Saprospiraceae bacterium]